MSKTQNASRFDQETELSSFPPYWSPEVGSSIEVIVLGVDRRDPEFERYVFQSAQDAVIDCERGKKGQRVTVHVKKGEEFTCSTYAGLNGLEEYSGLEVRISCVDTRDVGQPQPMFVFKIGTTAETRKQLSERRASMTKASAPGTSFPHGVNARG